MASSDGMRLGKRANAAVARRFVSALSVMARRLWPHTASMSPRQPSVLPVWSTVCHLLPSTPCLSVADLLAEIPKIVVSYLRCTVQTYRLTAYCTATDDPPRCFCRAVPASTHAVHAPRHDYSTVFPASLAQTCASKMALRPLPPAGACCQASELPLLDCWTCQLPHLRWVRACNADHSMLAEPTAHSNPRGDTCPFPLPGIDTAYIQSYHVAGGNRCLAPLHAASATVRQDMPPDPPPSSTLRHRIARPRDSYMYPALRKPPSPPSDI